MPTKPSSGTSINTSDAQGLAGSLAHVWAFLEGSGTTTADSKAGDTGTLVSPDVWSSDSAGPNISCPSGNGKITLATSILYNTLVTQWSVAWGCALAGVNNNGTIIGASTAAANYIWMKGTQGQIQLSVNNGGQLNFTPTLSMTSYHDYLLVFDVSGAGSATLYQDGTSVGTVALVTGNGGITIDTLLGSSSMQAGQGVYFNGTCDYIYVWANRPLTATDASNLHANPYEFFNPSKSFSFTDNAGTAITSLPANHVGGSVTVKLVGTNTGWTNPNTFTVSGVTGWSLTSATFVDTTHYTLVLGCPAITPPAGATGTLTVTDTVNSISATISIATPTLSISPTTSAINNTVTLTLTGANTLWANETAAGLFTESGGTGASIGTPTVTSDTAATASLTGGSTVSTETITDTSTGATATFTTFSGSGTITITSPRTYQVFQRNSSNQANIAITGTYTGSPTSLEASFNSGAFQTIVASPAGGTFAGTLTNQTQGQGTLTVRFSNDHTQFAQVPIVGIGELFLVSGQSNASTPFTNSQTFYNGNSLTACCFNGVWSIGNDNTASHPGPASGSIWPLLMTLLMADQNVPAAVVTTSVPNTGLTQYNSPDWTKGGINGLGGSEYSGMLTTITSAKINSFRANLYYQGEADAAMACPRGVYAGRLLDLFQNIMTDVAGAPPTIPFVIGYSQTTSMPDGLTAVDEIRLGIIDAVKTGTRNGMCYGPPTIYDQTNIVHPSSGGNPDSPLGIFEAARFWAVLKAVFFGGTNLDHGPRLQAITYDSTRTKLQVRFDQPLKTGLLFDTSIWTITGNGTNIGKSSITYTTDPNSVLITLTSAAATPILVSFGLGSTTGGKVVPISADIPLPTLPAPWPAVINMAAEPFAFWQASPDAGFSGTGGGGYLLLGSSFIQG